MEKPKFSIVFILLLAFLVQFGQILAIESETFNVIDYGAVGDGIIEDTQAFIDTWEATCKSSASNPLMLIPSGMTFLLQPFTFDGRHCKSTNITITISGELVAPSDLSEWKCRGNECRQWILFIGMKGLSIQGFGTINGQGSTWWKHTCQDNKRVCGKKPTSFILERSDGVQIDGLNFKDSPQMHFAIERSKNVYATNLVIRAPRDSPNTDGIHIQKSQDISIHRSIIATGDDCISIGDGSSRISIYLIGCGPGHGISIGSLGKQGQRDTVDNVRVKHVIFTDTMYGARIKTWQGGRGYARNISFEDVLSRGASNPIIITQFYCDHQKCHNQTSAVEISNVEFKRFYGTSNSKIAVNLACSESSPCNNIIMNDIHLESTKDGAKTSSFCGNVNGLTNGAIIPNVPCLMQTYS